jgi:hypothetical protein
VVAECYGGDASGAMLEPLGLVALLVSGGPLRRSPVMAVPWPRPVATRRARCSEMCGAAALSAVTHPRSPALCAASRMGNETTCEAHRDGCPSFSPPQGLDGRVTIPSVRRSGRARCRWHRLGRWSGFACWYKASRGSALRCRRAGRRCYADGRDNRVRAGCHRSRYVTHSGRLIPRGESRWTGFGCATDVARCHGGDRGFEGFAHHTCHHLYRLSGSLNHELGLSVSLQLVGRLRGVDAHLGVNHETL